MRVSKTANKQRERERERENRNSLRYDFLGAFLLRDNSSVKSSGDAGFHYEREREREIFSIGILHRHSAHFHIKMRHHRKPTARFNAFSGLEMLPMYGAILIVYDANSTFDPKFDLRKA